MDDAGRKASAAFYRSAAWLELRKAALRRDRWRCQAEGCIAPATHVDHVRQRPHAAGVTEADCLSNLRCLCAHHDAQIKELAGGRRRNGGRTRIVGADVAGWPLDPARR